MTLSILHSKFSKSLLAMLTMLVAFTTDALAGAKIYLENFYISPGETRVVSLMLDNDEPIWQVGYEIQLPEGLTIIDKSTNPERIADDSHTLSMSCKGGNWVVVLSNISQATIKGNSGAIAYLTFKADDTFKGGEITPVEWCLTTTDVDANGIAVEAASEAPTSTVGTADAQPFEGALTVSPSATSVTTSNTDVILSIGINNNKPVGQASFKVVLPNGLSPKTTGEGKVEVSYLDRLPASYKAVFNYKEQENTLICLLLTTEDDAIAAGTGELLSIGFVADVETLAENSEIAIKDIIIAEPSAVTAKLNEVTVAITNVTEDEPVYDEQAYKDALRTVDALKNKLAGVWNVLVKDYPEESKDNDIRDNYNSLLDSIKKLAEAIEEKNNNHDTDYTQINKDAAAIEKAISNFDLQSLARIASLRKNAAMSVADDLADQLDKAWSNINSNYPDAAASSDIQDEKASIAEDINDLKTAIEHGYENGVMNYTSILANADDIKAAIAKLTDDAANYKKPQAPVENCDLTADMFCTWDNYLAGANITATGVGAYALGVSTGLPYGDGSVFGCNYADLSAWATLALTVTEGAPRLLFNRPGMGGDQPGYIEINSADSPYVQVVAGVWYIDLAKLVAENGYAHLNCIKGANWANTTITEAKLLVDSIDDVVATGINGVTGAKLPAGIYTITGTKVETLQKGINIVVDENGNTRKVRNN